LLQDESRLRVDDDVSGASRREGATGREKKEK
jgi:hypothetical protein